LDTDLPNTIVQSDENININNNEVSKKEEEIFNRAVEDMIENRVKLRLEKEGNKEDDDEEQG
jgi:hypothetical protein